MGLSNTISLKGHSVSVVVPAYNEEQNLEATVESIHKALSDKYLKYEIIIINDGSHDNTGKLAEALAERDSRIKVIHNQKNSGYGYTFLRGAIAANYEYTQLIPADGEIPSNSIKKIADTIGEADLILPYIENFHIRTFARRVISVGYTLLLNVLFFLNIRYYNGPLIIKTTLLKSIPVKATGFAFMASIVIQAIKKYGCSYTQTGILLAPRLFGNSNCTIRKILGVTKTIGQLFWEINILRKK